jgi:hypothetical protein
MTSLGQSRFDEVRMQKAAGEWAVLSPVEFSRMDLAQRVQLLVTRRLRFFLRGVEISPVQALKD